MLQAVSKFKGGTFAGKMKKEEKEEAKRQQVIFATYSMCTDAFDCPSLEKSVISNTAKILSSTLNLRKTDASCAK